MVMKKGALDEYLNRKMNSYQWIKKVPLDQLMSEMKTFKVKPYFKTEPWVHQAACFLIGMTEPRFGHLLDMGAGKSKIVLDTMTQLQREGRLKKALVTIPRLVNFASWEKACAVHSDLEPEICTGSIEEKWEHLLTNKADLAIIDYTGLQLALSKKVVGKKKVLAPDLKKINQLKKIYNFAAIDESHKLKNAESLRYRILRPLTKDFDNVYITTGTLFGRNPEDLWSQFFLVDRGDTFGDSLGMFREAFMVRSDGFWAGQKYDFDKKKTRLLNKFLQNRSIRYDENELESLPECVPNNLVLRFGEEQRGHYLRALEGLINAQGKLSEIDSAFIRMRQIVSGYLQWKDSYGDHVIRFKENPKLEMLLGIIEDSGDSKVVVSTEYTQTGSLIVDALKEMKIGYEWLYGKTKDPVACIKSFQENPKKKVLVMNSDCGGTGVDGLQEVAQYLVFYESPVSPVTRKQTLKRIHRSGQLHRSFIYDLTIEKSIDIRILGFIKEGNDLHSSVVSGNFNVGTLLRDLK
jgi:SNF2 family DNA or RNA helicase